MDDLLLAGVKEVQILGHRNTSPHAIGSFLVNADLVINGANPKRDPYHPSYLITKTHIAEILAPGAVVVDLIGGSPENRSPVESVVNCTFLANPYFIEEGVFVTALWGWPMMGMMQQTAVKYSGQIREVLLDSEALLKGLDSAPDGCTRAILNRASV